MQQTIAHFLTMNKFPLIGGLFLYFTIKIIISKIRFKAKKLEALGFWEITTNTVNGRTTKKPPKGKINYKNGYLFFSHYNPSIIGKIQNPEFLNSLEAIYHRKFIRGEIAKIKFLGMFMQAPLVFYFEHLPEKLTLKDKPENAKYPNIWFGRDVQNRDVIVNQENAHATLILGRAGSGKGILARTLIKQYPNHRKIIIDDKGSDFLDLSNEIYNPTDTAQFKGAVEKIEEYVSECDEFKLELQRNNIQVNHWNRIKNKPTPYLIMMDEMSQYLKLEKNGDKDREELKARLIKSVSKILQLYRVSGTVVIGMSQSSNQSDYDISFNNFATRVYSRQNAQQSVNLIGSHVLNDQELFAGVFYIHAPLIETKFKAPFNALPATTNGADNITVKFKRGDE